MTERLAEHRHNLVLAVAASMSTLARAPHWREAADAALGPVCEAARADRAVILRFEGEGRAAISRRVSIWMRPDARETCPEAFTQLLTLPFVGDGKDFSHHLEAFNAGHAMTLASGPALAESDRWLMALARVQSCLRVPVMVRERLWGALGFDTLNRHRLWLENEMLAVWSLARTLGAMIERDGD